MVDLERIGKKQRQAGRDTFISDHAIEDVGRLRSVIRSSRLMVRVNPLHAGTFEEVEVAISQGADLLMLPMFQDRETLAEFARIVDGRRPIVPLVETAQALASVQEWIALAGLWEVFVGLNDLHLSLGMDFMFEPLVRGDVEKVALCARAQGLRFGFGGIARLEEGLLPGRSVLAEHLRLGSRAVILSRTFHRPDVGSSFEAEVLALRQAERELAGRSSAQVNADAKSTMVRICEIAQAVRARDT